METNWWSVAPTAPETETGPSQGPRPEGKENTTAEDRGAIRGNTRTDKDLRGIREEAYPVHTETTPPAVAYTPSHPSEWGNPAAREGHGLPGLTEEYEVAPQWYNRAPGAPGSVMEKEPEVQAPAQTEPRKILAPPPPDYDPTVHKDPETEELEKGLVAKVRERWEQSRLKRSKDEVVQGNREAKDEAVGQIREHAQTFRERHPGFSHEGARRFFWQGLTMWFVSPTTILAAWDRISTLWTPGKFATTEPRPWNLMSGPASWMNKAFELYVQTSQMQELVTTLAVCAIPVVVCEVWRTSFKNNTAIRWILRTPLAGYVTAIVFYSATVGTGVG